MTARETIDIIRDSSLWQELSLREKIEAVTYAMKFVNSSCDDEDIRDIIGEVFKG